MNARHVVGHLSDERKEAMSRQPRCPAPETECAALREELERVKRWVSYRVSVGCPCTTWDGKLCNYSNPAEANNFLCSCVYHLAKEKR